jgi:Cell division septal protein
MMKRVFSIVVLVLLLVYIGIALAAFCPRPEASVCDGIELMGKSTSQFETQEEIISLLSRFGLNPVGKPMNEISCSAIEDSLRTLPLVLHCDCFKSVGSKVGIAITCRTPIMRIIPDKGTSGYIDREGILFDRLPKPVYLPVATGNIDKEFAEKELYEMACFLQKSKFWNAQIEQINVTAAHDLELVPRVGDHIIRFGKVERVRQKFSKLQTFYEKGLNQVGWNRYSIIDIRYGDQVIGIK